MATGYSIVNRALRLCKVIDADSAASASEAQDAFDVLNAMLAEWHSDGVGLPDYSFDTLETVLASNAADAEAIAYQLAIRIAPEYGAQLDPLALETAAATMGRLRLRYFQPGTVCFDELPSDRSTFNIVTG
jgi:hypothetical protein